MTRVALGVFATGRAEKPQPKPDYSRADAPYTAQEVVVMTPAGHTLTLPTNASGARVTVTGAGLRLTACVAHDLIAADDSEARA